MTVYLTPEFLQDLSESDDLKLVRQVLKHTLSPEGSFLADSDDHRYEGIDDAWIRIVSRGKTAFRVIFIRQDSSVYLYRAGLHSVEDHLQQPKKLDQSIPIGRVPSSRRKMVTPTGFDLGKLLKTREAEYFPKVVTSMFHVPHKEIIVVSPFVSPDVIGRYHQFGRFLDKAVAEATRVTLVTSPPDDKTISVYRNLAERDISVYFLTDLHAKLYVFKIRERSLSTYNRHCKDIALIGSSNLTKMGFGFEGGACNIGLCYQLPDQKYEEAYNYAKKLINASVDFNSFVRRYKRR